MSSSKPENPVGLTGQDAASELARGLSLRHILFIALGSAIGTGLFLGSASAIRFAGPSVLLAYVIGGAAVFMVMRAMGEMALAHPVAGAFSDYATRYLGPWAGFVTGWSYAFEMALVAVADVTAVALYMRFWFPQSPSWVWILSVILVILAINLTTVKVFGEAEFWFTVVKVGAVLAMIIGGILLLILGVQMNASAEPSVTHLWDQGGFFPQGLTGFLACFTVVMFAFGGIETIGVTAGEAADPKSSIPKAVNTVPVRILVFYVLTMGVIMSLSSWQQITTEQSPFVQIFSALGIPAAAHLLNLVILTAAVSAINADMYGAGRMLYGLAQQGLAPASFAAVSRAGIPWLTVMCMGVVLACGVLLNWLFEEAFLIIASLATFATVLVWIMILVTHLGFKRHLIRAQGTSEFPTPLWPVASWAALAFMLGVMALLGFFPETRTALWVGAGWCLLLGLLWPVVRRRGSATAAPAQR